MQIERELLKGVLPLAVMKLLKRRAMYGYELVTEVAQRSDGVLKLGQSTLYPLLYNLEAQGLVESEWQESEGGRDRKYYKLTEKGMQRLERDLTQWEALVHGMGRLVLGGQEAQQAWVRL
ncbi:MAG: PadR family transcriptional regulator [Planctomycetota bacterium]|nr:MAG: PadR family transcriptional regulator [Planctomycetota bacterium]